MKHLFYFLICLFFCNIANAQTDTTQLIYDLEKRFDENGKIKNQKEDIILKIVNQSRNFDFEKMLQLVLDQQFTDGKLVIYQDETFTKALNKAKYDELTFEFDWQKDSLRMDSLFRTSRSLPVPVHLNNDFKILFPSEETVYQLTQYWYFDTITQQLRQKTTAVNIGVLSSRKFKPTFTLKNNATPVKSVQAELDKSNVIWAKRIWYDITFNDSLHQFLANKNHFAAHKIVDNFGKLITTEQAIYNYFDGRDTLIAFNPETFEEELKVVFHCYDSNSEAYKTFRIIQDIYFDISTNSFNTKVIAVIPMRAMYDDVGNFKYYKYYFRIVYDEDFLKWFD